MDLCLEQGDGDNPGQRQGEQNDQGPGETSRKTEIIKNAGGVVTNPFGSVIRSLLVAIIELGVEEIMVIGHTDCGVQHIDSESMIAHMKQRGVSQASIDLMKYCGIDFERWLAGFDTVEQSVTDTVNTIRNHPLMPRDVRIGGYVIDTETGELSTVCKG